MGQQSCFHTSTYATGVLVIANCKYNRVLVVTLYGLVFVTPFPSFVPYISRLMLSLGRGPMIPLWTPIPPKDIKEETDRVAIQQFPIAFGTCVNPAMEPCRASPCFLPVFIYLFGFSFVCLSYVSSFYFSGTSLP